MKQFLHLDKLNFFFALIIILLCSLWFASCGPTKEEMEAAEAAKPIDRTDSNYTTEQPVVKYYHGHKYVRFGGTDVRSYWGGHAGDCKNKSHH
jgi:hypothetical protein